jgi:hypothetical protein
MDKLLRQKALMAPDLYGDSRTDLSNFTAFGSDNRFKVEPRKASLARN